MVFGQFVSKSRIRIAEATESIFNLQTRLKAMDDNLKKEIQSNRHKDLVISQLEASCKLSIDSAEALRKEENDIWARKLQQELAQLEHRLKIERDELVLKMEMDARQNTESQMKNHLIELQALEKGNLARCKELEESLLQDCRNKIQVVKKDAENLKILLTEQHELQIEELRKHHEIDKAKALNQLSELSSNLSTRLEVFF